MTLAPGTRRRAAALAGLAGFVLLGLLGVFLRVVRWRDWPPGPWVDEAYVLRAARLSAGAPLFGTSPLEPPEAGFVNAYVSNVYLAVARAVDRLAGGGMASFRALSIGPALLLLGVSLLLAWEAARERPAARLPAALVLSTSMWLLTTGRWGWDVVATTALAVLAAYLGLVAWRCQAMLLAVLSGAAVGLAQYGSVASRLSLAAAPLLLVYALARRNRPLARPATAALAASLVVAAPLAAHFSAHPERAVARSREISLLGRPVGEAVSGLARNVVDYAALFIARGDRNERHGSRDRSVLPPAVSVLALMGAATGFVRGGAARWLFLFAALFLVGGLLSAGGANAYRISPAAPYLIILAALGAVSILERLPVGARRVGAAVMWGAFVLSAAGDVTCFAAWADSPRTWGAFGGPERDLADAFAAQAGSGGADFALNRETAARNEVVVDVLLDKPTAAGHAVHVLALSPAATWRWVPSRDVLYADAGTPAVRAAVERLGGREVARGRVFPPAPAWVLYRLPREAVAREAAQLLGRFPSLAPTPFGQLLAEEDGLYTFAAKGGVTAWLGGQLLVSTASGSVAHVRLSRGRYRLELRALSPGGRLRVVAPSGFLVPLEAPSGESLSGRPTP